MKTYRIISEIQAEPMDRNTAGRKGYLNYFDGSLPVDKSDGYIVFNELIGHHVWIESENFEKHLYKDNK